MDFQTVYRQYHPRLLKVEELLHHSVRSTDAQLMESATQLLEAGGKRIRPLFALICGRLGEGEDSHVEAVAGALELIHMATLVHDDVIDNSALRRGRPTVRSQYGNRAAMYTGDFLFARAIGLLSQIDNSAVHREVSMALVRLCEGEIEQVRDFYNWEQSLRTYLRRIERKTALLISVSCSLGAMVSNAKTTTVKLLRRFGYFTGMAFQIIDDVLDFTGSQEVVGKPVGGDLRQGNLTLPALCAANDSSIKAKLKKLVREGIDEAAITEAIEIVRESGALEQSRELALKYLQRARNLLDEIPQRDIRRELIVVAEFVNQRLF